MSMPKVYADAASWLARMMSRSSRCPEGRAMAEHSQEKAMSECGTTHRAAKVLRISESHPERGVEVEYVFGAPDQRQWCINKTGFVLKPGDSVKVTKLENQCVVYRFVSRPYRFGAEGKIERIGEENGFNGRVVTKQLRSPGIIRYIVYPEHATHPSQHRIIIHNRSGEHVDVGDFVHCKHVLDEGCTDSSLVIDHVVRKYPQAVTGPAKEASVNTIQVRGQEPALPRLRELTPGTIFTYEGCETFYILTRPKHATEFNADNITVCALTSGVRYEISGDKRVVPVKPGAVVEITTEPARPRC